MLSKEELKNISNKSEFCRKHNIKISTLCRWMKDLNIETAKARDCPFTKEELVESLNDKSGFRRKHGVSSTLLYGWYRKYGINFRKQSLAPLIRRYGMTADELSEIRDKCSNLAKQYLDCVMNEIDTTSPGGKFSNAHYRRLAKNEIKKIILDYYGIKANV